MLYGCVIVYYGEWTKNLMANGIICYQRGGGFGWLCILRVQMTHDPYYARLSVSIRIPCGDFCSEL